MPLSGIRNDGVTGSSPVCGTMILLENLDCENPAQTAPSRRG
jgi:hypothetical protein